MVYLAIIIIIIIFHYSPECSNDFVEVYTRRRLTNWQREIFSVFTFHNIQTQEGRMCDERGITLIITSNSSDIMLVYIHMDDSGSGRNLRGLNVIFTAVGKYFTVHALLLRHESSVGLSSITNPKPRRKPSQSLLRPQTYVNPAKGRAT